MQPLSTQPTTERHRSWLVELLVVVGILGFGYFAVVMESAPRSAPAVETATH